MRVILTSMPEAWAAVAKATSRPRILGVPACEEMTAILRQPARCSRKKASRPAATLSSIRLSGPSGWSSRLIRMTCWPLAMQVSISDAGGVPDKTTVALAR
ncbi:hypothetical protein FQZ97_1060620 [compost metagenome]